MALDPNRWTLKTQEAFNAAVDRARAANNPEVTPDHLLAVMLGQEGTAVLPVLQKVGVAPLAVRNKLDDALSKLPAQLRGLPTHRLRHAGQGLAGPVAQRQGRHPDLPEDGQHDAFGLAQQSGHEVVGGDLGMGLGPGLLDGGLHGLLRAQGPAVRIERHVSHPPGRTLW